MPAGPFPPGINNRTSYTGSTLTGHTICLIVQGLIHSTRMALSEVGTQADVDLLESVYIENWWLEALAARDVTVISHKLYDAHNCQWLLRGRSIVNSPLTSPLPSLTAQTNSRASRRTWTSTS